MSQFALMLKYSASIYEIKNLCCYSKSKDIIFFFFENNYFNKIKTYLMS